MSSELEKAVRFGTRRTSAQRPGAFRSKAPWRSPQVLDLDTILKLAPLEERIYRHRCVEAWSIVVPWIGFPLSTLIKLANPLSTAKYVAFQSLYDPKQMPEGRYAGIPLPYVEGLRMDEAMHPLALLSMGLYGEVLPNQTARPSGL